MNTVRIGQLDSDQVVYVGWKALEACLVAHEPMDIYQK